MAAPARILTVNAGSSSLKLRLLGPGDEVLARRDGAPGDDPQAVRYRFATKGLGGKVTVRYLRDGRALETQVALEAPPETPPADRTTIKGRNPFAGATVANLSPAVADELGLDSMSGKGVRVRASSTDAQLWWA